MPTNESDEKTIVIRDRRKPNQYTTDNVIAREWLPVLRVGDAFFFYSVYLSMANRETESSWGSLRTMAEYLQCGVDLIIRGNKLLEICELLYIETGDHRTSNEYYILDPPPLTPELKERIYQRLDDIAAQETSVNWRSWVKQVRKALGKHRSLPDIWAERRAKRGGRPVKTARAEKGGCDSQSGFMHEPEKGACEPQPGCLWPTTRVLVSHNQGACEPQPEQEQLTRKTNKVEEEAESDLSLVQAKCRQLGVAPTVVDVLLEKYPADRILQQLEWLPFRQPRDPAAMLVSAVQGDWAKPVRYGQPPVQKSLPRKRVCTRGTPHPSPRHGTCLHGDCAERTQMQEVWPDEVMSGSRSDDMSSSLIEAAGGPASVSVDPEQDDFAMPGTDLDARNAWVRVLEELRMQMTRTTFDTWLGGSQVVCVQDEAITVQVRDEYAAEWLRARWNTPIRRTLTGIVGRPVEVRFKGPL